MMLQNVLFHYEIGLLDDNPVLSGTYFELRGLFLHNLPTAIDMADEKGGDRLRLGYCVYADANRTSIKFEDRAKFNTQVLEPTYPHEFRAAIPAAATNGDHNLLFLDCLYENRYWFWERGGLPFSFLLRREGDRLRIESANSCGSAENSTSRVAERLFPKLSPDLLKLVAESIRAVATKYGTVLAIEFAYLYILGRRADPQGLAEKSRALSQFKMAIEDICAQMMTCEEFRRRDVLRLRDPLVVVKSWAEIPDER
jgi:hypothetical protein